MNIDEAIAFAALAHGGQKRKYTGEPYIVHPIEVMSIVHNYGADETMLMAAVLHDVVEDCGITLQTIGERFGGEVESLVDGLTDQFTSESYPDLNRAARKARERDRLAGCDPAVQTIKYADLISNTQSIVIHDRNFARKYLDEKEKLLEVMNEGNPELFSLAKEFLARGQEHLMRSTLH
jgi:(p)ppGpp synthase/HD superfamily hydrolase